MAPKKPARVHRFKSVKTPRGEKQAARAKKAIPLKMGKVRPAVK